MTMLERRSPNDPDTPTPFVRISLKTVSHVAWAGVGFVVLFLGYTIVRDHACEMPMAWISTRDVVRCVGQIAEEQQAEAMRAQQAATPVGTESLTP